MTTVGFIGLGNVGAKLAGSLLRHGTPLIVRDLDRSQAAPFLEKGAQWADSPAQLTRESDVIITCLPSPGAVAEVMESDDGVISQMCHGKIWMEMSTTDTKEVLRLGEQVKALGAQAADCPVSGGCHRAATGNIAILAGCERDVFEKLMPLLSILGREILHTGELGTASTIKVMTNYLATANLITLCEALMTSKMAGLNLGNVYEAIRISSGNSFVHETESQVILNGSRDINFTMDLVLKDIGLFQDIADNAGVPLEISPKLIEIFQDGQRRYGPREWSSNIMRRLEDTCGVSVTAPGFPAQMVDDQPEQAGHEVLARTAKPDG